MAARLFVGNLSFEVLENELQELFAQAGTVVSVNVMQDRMTGKGRGFGFVEMSSDEEAHKAIEMFNGKEFQGRNLTVNVASLGKSAVAAVAAVAGIEEVVAAAEGEEIAVGVAVAVVVVVVAAAIEEADIEDCLRNNTRGRESQLIEIKLKRNEPVEKGLRRLKKQMLREGVIKELRKRRHYEKPSVTIRRKTKAARFEAMLKQRHADD